MSFFPYNSCNCTLKPGLAPTMHRRGFYESYELRDNQGIQREKKNIARRHGGYAFSKAKEPLNSYCIQTKSLIKRLYALVAFVWTLIRQTTTKTILKNSFLWTWNTFSQFLFNVLRPKPTIFYHLNHQKQTKSNTKQQKHRYTFKKFLLSLLQLILLIILILFNIVIINNINHNDKFVICCNPLSRL